MLVKRTLWVLVVVLVVGLFPGIVAANDVQQEIEQNYQAISQLARERNYPEMIQLLRRNQELDPTNFRHYVQEAYAYSQWYFVVRNEQGLEASLPYYRQAITMFQRAGQVAEQYNADPVYIANIYYDQGILAFDVRDTTTARRAVSRSLALFPEGVRYNNLMGRVLLYEEGTQGVISDTMKRHYYIAARNNRDTGYYILPAYYWGATYAYEQGQLDVAIALLREGIQIIESYDGVPSTEYTLIGEPEEFYQLYGKELFEALNVLLDLNE